METPTVLAVLLGVLVGMNMAKWPLTFLGAASAGASAIAYYELVYTSVGAAALENDFLYFLMTSVLLPFLLTLWGTVIFIRLFVSEEKYIGALRKLKQILMR